MLALLHDPAIWVAISFAIFAVLAFRAGKDKVLAKLDGRIAEIRKEIETAESLRIEAQELLAQYQRKQRDAAKEAESIVANAREQAAAITKDAEAELAAITARREEQLAARLARMEENAVQEIRTRAAALAVKATMEIIAREMNDNTNARLIDESIKQVGGRLN